MSLYEPSSDSSPRSSWLSDSLATDIPAFETELERAVALATIEASVFGGTSVAPSVVELGHYRLECKLGAGGMGEVFAARHAQTGERVALKYLRHAVATRLYRFKQEFRALAGIEHHNLVGLHELVVLPDGGAFFTMEEIRGAQSFTDYVLRGAAPGSVPNIARLTRALRQLVAGVAHLHAHGYLHRDLKPSNILVTPEGRVVVVDFGLAVDVAAADGPTRSGQIVGTLAYMAPEQAASRAVGPPADAYAIGAVLHECLTGERLHEGTVFEVLAAKQRASDPLLPPAVPAPLRELCVALLHTDPSARPSLTDVLEQLGGEALRPRAQLGRARGQGWFMGRTAQLEQLAGCLAELGESVSVRVRGHSGSGKSALVQHFLAGRAQVEGSWTLHGRCFASESMPHKGVDGIIDSLALRLHQLSALARARLQPRRSAALSGMFPVLDGLWDSAEVLGGMDPAQRRRWGIAALRELLARIGDEHELILFIDDFQWADVDSVELLDELTRGPDSPRMLLIIAFRPEPDNPVLAALTEPRRAHARSIRELDVGPLAPAEATALAEALLQARERSVGAAAAVVHESGGNPFFIMQAIAHDGSGVHERERGRSVDEIVAARILALDDACRRLLAAIAVAGRPVRLDVSLLAAGCVGLEDRLQLLRELELVELRGLAPADTITTAHDRIREVMVAELDTDELSNLHLALAHGYETHGDGLHGAGAQVLADHYEQGGDRAMALTHVERAAVEAVETFAFERAVELYRRGLGLLGADDGRARRAALEHALAEQLVNLGRSSEAVEVLHSLARHAASPAQANVYRCQAVEQLLHSGAVEQGLVELRVALANVGIRLPRRTSALVAAILWNRAVVWLRRRRVGVQAVQQPTRLDAGAHARLAILLSSTLGMLFEDTLHSSLFGPLLLRAAAETGAPRYLGWALFIEITSCVSTNRRASALARARELRALAAASPDPVLVGLEAHADAASYYLRLRWREADVALSRALELSEQTPSLMWLGGKLLATYAYVRLQLGAFADLHARLGRWRADASRRGNRYEIAFLTAIASLVERFVGERDECLRLMAEGKRSRSTQGYHYADGMLDVAQISIDLYEGRLPAAVGQVVRTSQATRDKFLDMNPLVGPVLLELHATCFVCQAIARPDDPRARRQARRSAARLRRIGQAASLGHAAVIMAALHTLDGDREAALDAWRDARQLLSGIGRAGVCAAICVRLADADEHGADQLRAQASDYFARQGIREPKRFVAMYAPAASTSEASTHAESIDRDL